MLGDNVATYWRELHQLVAAVPVADVARAAELILACHDRNGRIFVLGNGGSAATASHFATDLGKGTRTPGIQPVRVLALTENVALLTALGNDLGYDRVFAEQLETLLEPDDVVVLISASGNSLNVLAAADVARARGATLVALTGQSGGRLHRLADHSIRVPARPIEQVEDAHLMIAHSICVALRETFQARSGGKVLAANGSRRRRSAIDNAVSDALGLRPAADKA
jgi:D-sedoheptulose 7-phosphate isomerase